jgi:hypothetical protein
MEDNIKADIEAIDLDLIHLTQDKDKWRALVRTRMNLPSRRMLGLF